MAKNLDNVPAPSDRKWEDELVIFKFEKVEQYQFRLIGDIFVFGRHWVATKPNDIDSGKKFPRECTNFDPDSETHCLDRGCPTCMAEKDTGTPDKSISSSHHYLINAIDRRAQEDGMRNPIKALGPLPPTLISQIVDLKKSNRAKGTKDGYHVTHAEFGRDILLKYNASATPRWSVNADLDGQSPLTDAEKAYKLFDFDSIYPNFALEDVANAYNEDSLKSLKRCGYFDNGEVVKPAPRATQAQKASKPVTEPKAAAEPEPAGDDDSEEKVVAGPKAKAAAKAAPKAEGSTELGVCPHADQDEHSFGNFQADAFCMRCPQRMACMAASDGN